MGLCEIHTFTISQYEKEEEIPLSADEQQARQEWEQQARQERAEDRELSTRQHALMALGRAAEWRACVEVYMQEPSLPQPVDDLTPQRSPVPPAGRPRRPAPKARQWNAIAEHRPGSPRLPDVHAQRVRRPAPAARQRSASSDNARRQPAEAQVISSDDGMCTDRSEVSQDRSATLPTISVTRDESDASLSS